MGRFEGNPLLQSLELLTEHFEKVLKQWRIMREALELIAKNAPEMGGDWALMKAQAALAEVEEIEL